MANYPVLPFRFLPGPVSIEASPPDRLQRNLVVVSDPPLQHEEFAIITVSTEILDVDKEAMLAKICAILAQDHQAPVDYASVSGLGVGLVSFSSSVIRDQLVDHSPHALDDEDDENATFSLIRHDEGLNMRSPVFESEAWVLMLNFSLDYQTQYYVNKAVSCFGQLMHWHNPRVNKTRVLVKVAIKLVRLMPFSLVVTRAASLFGTAGRSWSVPIYLLNGRSMQPENLGDEDPVPPLNVTPHPYALPFLSEMQQHHLDVQI
jgi:hypothetical protein